jgi:CheY-like chemotaxis protein
MKPAKHILFVEDSTALRDPLTALLELKGFRVGWARNGCQALDYLRHGQRPDLILLDLKLPDMDGWQFRREQRRDPALATIPVVVVSGTKDAARRAADLAAAACLEKPVGFDELVEAVRQNC